MWPRMRISPLSTLNFSTRSPFPRIIREPWEVSRKIRNMNIIQIIDMDEGAAAVSADGIIS